MTASVADLIEQFRAAMADKDVIVDGEIEADGVLHRVHNGKDKKGSKNAWYILHIDEKPSGMFGCNKRWGKQKLRWKPDQEATPLTAEERAAYRERAKAERAEKDRLRKIVSDNAAVLANKIWAHASPVFHADHPYLDKKQVSSFGLRVCSWEHTNKLTGEIQLVSSNTLIVPLMDKDRKIRSIQAIFPNDKNIFKRDKTYLPDGDKMGLFFPVGKKPLQVNGRNVFILAEGYATGATIHMVTGHMVIVCFDCGNLQTVAEQIRASQPAAEIIIACDNDQWTVHPVANPGLHYGTLAAEAVDGKVALPPIPASAGVAGPDGKITGPTDFNDLFAARGFDEVRAVFDKVFNPSQVNDAVPEFSLGEENDDAGTVLKVEKPITPYDDEIGKNQYFALLGFDHSTYFFFLKEKGQVISYSISELSANKLIELAPLQFWEMYFPSAKGGIDVGGAVNRIVRESAVRGIYNPDNVRGCGAWRDSNRYIFHMGDHLRLGTQSHPLFSIDTKFIYPKAKSLPTIGNIKPMSAEEGKGLLEIAQKVRWTKPGSAYLVAGWMMLAPVCGILKWRPHIWLTGKAGSGKSAFQSRFLGTILQGMSVYAQGNSTEPGIRQTLRYDALPVLVDEIESNNETERRRVEAILSMVRQASSETQAKVMKGSSGGAAMSFLIRSMFCLASINTQLNKKSDIDRLTRLNIAGTDDEGPENRWDELDEDLHKIEMDDTLPNRFLARAIAMIPVITKSVEVFTTVAARQFNSQRYGDQFGTLLAGVWCLACDHAPSEKAAATLIARFNWSEHIEDSIDDDAERALEAILGSSVQVGTSGPHSIYKLICEVVHPSPKQGILNDIFTRECEDVLKQHGIRVDKTDRLLLFGVSVTKLQQLVSKLSFGTDLKGQLARIKDASRFDGKSLKFNGVSSRVIAIPLDPILDDSDSFSLDSPL